MIHDTCVIHARLMHETIMIQVKGMACAEDIKNAMSYKGLNAASARLNNLFKRGILQRYQLGHKVYYKYDAGKTTNTLIISPHIR